MKKKGWAMKRHYQAFQKNMEALKQANITPAQMANLIKSWNVWWKVTVNLREIEGSWTKALKKYIMLFEGVPKKSIHQSQNNQPDTSASDNR